MSENAPYNPLDKKNLGASVAEALLERTVHPLGEIERFFGAGIYAIYYTGDFQAYRSLVARNEQTPFSAPIYVGKAVPNGARKGGIGSGESTGALFSRLNQHAASVRSVGSLGNIRIEDFYARYLVVDDIWIPLGESLLISRFAPVWNSLLDGFGNHAPGKGRYEGLRPRWDVLHPGRAWADQCQQRSETPQELVAAVEHYFDRMPAAPKPSFHEGGES